MFKHHHVDPPVSLDTFKNVNIAWMLQYKCSIPTPMFASGFHQSIRNRSNNSSFLISECIPVPFVDLKPSDPDAIYSALMFVACQMEKFNVKSITHVTFDMQLYIIAKSIQVSTLNDIISKKILIRLGGFHTCLNLQGCIGKLMQGSGLNEALLEVYGNSTINHILSGHAYARCVRALTLCYVALFLISMKDFKFEITDQLLHLIENPYELLDSSLLSDLSTLIYNNLEQNNSYPTAKLWIQFMEYVELMNTFISAERTGDFELHLYSLQKMLPIFFACGHINYAKYGTIYYQDLIEFKNQLTEQELADYKQKCFTVRRTDNFNGGTWTDMCIEQDLMKNIQVQGQDYIRQFHVIPYKNGDSRTH